MLDIVLVGACAVDTMIYVDSIPEYDDLVFAKKVKVTPGGSTANIAVGLSRLGAKCGIMCKVCSDRFGKLIIKSFSRENVDYSKVVVDKGGKTARTIIIVDKLGRRIIISLGGKAIIEREEEVDLSYVTSSKLVYVGESLPNIAERIVNAAKYRKIPVIYGPGVFSYLGLEKLGRILECVDVLVLNVIELRRLIPNTRDIHDAVRKLANLGIRIIVVTLGSRGSLAYVREEDRVYEQRAFKVRARDTTGAGDAFAAGLIYGYLKGLHISDALILGSAVAALKVRKLGVRALPTLEKVVEFLNKNGYTDLGQQVKTDRIL